MQRISDTPEMTAAIARAIGATAKPGDVIILSGDLGAGKTTMTKGIAEGLGLTQIIKSPTYTIIREYQQGKIPLYHMDIYRVGEEPEDLGLEEYFDGDGLSVVEWGELLGAFLPKEYVTITLEKDNQELTKRRLSFEAVGSSAADYLERMKEKMEEEE